jgi:dipeptidyl-peptidase-4
VRSRVAHLHVRLLVVLLALLVSGVARSRVRAQEPRGNAPPVITPADYARAESFLAPALTDLVIGGTVMPSWLPDDRFTYRSTTAEGSRFLLVDPAKRTQEPAFNHARLAATLTAATGRNYTERELPFQTIEVSPDGRTVSFDLETRRWSCDVQGTKCAATGDARTAQRESRRTATADRVRVGADVAVQTSPDGKRTVFIRNWNLWLREAATNRERPLTTDGVKDFGYATDNAGWRSSSRAIVLWSPDSRKIATFQQDERKVGDMYLVDARAGHPVLKTWKYPLPGDETVAMLQRVIINIDTAEVVRLQMPPDYHRATLEDDFSVTDMKWSPDSSRLAFVSTSRDHKEAVLRVADAATGSVRTVFNEKVATQFESRTGWHVLWPASEVIWYSQRDNWGQLYLYDLTTGKLKNQITTGEGPVSEITRIDEKNRTIWFGAMGREKGQDPYFTHYYRIGMDGRDYVPLTSGNGDHEIQLSPSGRFLVDTYSRCDAEPVVELRDAEGRLVMPLAKADVSRLLATGWKPPIPIIVKADDGKTDLYGMMFRPTKFDPSKKYPIINYAYPGPQTGSVGDRRFATARRDNQALAELGFIVVSIDGRGTPGRSKAFHDAYYGAMGRDNTIPDQVAGMKDLARRFPWIDIDRAGIWGHSGGGFIAADAMFRYPDFFKVGISESGNHDQRVYEDDWGERYQGLLVRGADGTDNYEAEANQSVAANLKGHLLLAHGMMDNNVPPYNTLLVVDALIKANKDFDLVLFPHAAHAYGADANYMMRRRWDYFVRWLLGAEPPKEYLMKPPPARGRGGQPPGH